MSGTNCQVLLKYRNYIQEYIHENESKVILLSATPYNKTYLDLSNQLRLFVDETEDLGIRPEQYIKSLGGVIAFNSKHQSGIRTLQAFEHSEYIDDWRELMRRYLVRRTRSFIMDNYAETDPETKRKFLLFSDGTPSYFPTRVPKTITFTIDDKDPDVTGRVGTAFYAERVTKKFYDRFKKEHDAFLKFLSGIPDEEMQKWYVSVMLNRLMFIYFIQKKNFLDSDTNYLRTKLTESQANSTNRYYRDFLCPLFFEGFAKPEDERSREMKRLLGKIPYLNGGIFQKHQLETLHGENIEIPDTAFEQIFNFFEQYDWHLDDRPLKNDNEINPDVLGYIFEKYINQKQMGAYYTKEDITEYISKNTIIPFLFDKAKKACKIAFEGEASVWNLLQEDPDRYIYDSVKNGIYDTDGVKKNLPSEIAIGIDDVSKRTDWNTLADPDYALPTEIWRETVARRQRYETVRSKLANGEVRDINDLITYNLDIRQFAQDVIENCEGPELLRAFWKAITEVTILDPTCGSGAFLFAALNILEPLYEACLDRMQVFLDETRTVSSLIRGAGGLEDTPKKPNSRRYNDFRELLDRIDEHPNRKYFTLKSIIINNLYGVDIMDEAIEICKLRLFLKMVAQLEDVKRIEPLPDIDFIVNPVINYTLL